MYYQMLFFYSSLCVTMHIHQVFRRKQSEFLFELCMRIRAKPITVIISFIMCLLFMMTLNLITNRNENDFKFSKHICGTYIVLNKISDMNKSK